MNRNPYATTIILTPETDKLIREQTRRKGDLSNLINQLITEKYGKKEAN